MWMCVPDFSTIQNTHKQTHTHTHTHTCTRTHTHTHNIRFNEGTHCHTFTHTHRTSHWYMLPLVCIHMYTNTPKDHTHPQAQVCIWWEEFDKVELVMGWWGCVWREDLSTMLHLSCMYMYIHYMYKNHICCVICCTEHRYTRVHACVCYGEHVCVCVWACVCVCVCAMVSLFVWSEKRLGREVCGVRTKRLGRKWEGWLDRITHLGL